jgi:hypothetical protein
VRPTTRPQYYWTTQAPVTHIQQYTYEQRPAPSQAYWTPPPPVIYETTTTSTLAPVTQQPPATVDYKEIFLSNKQNNSHQNNNNNNNNNINNNNNDIEMIIDDNCMKCLCFVSISRFIGSRFIYKFFIYFSNIRSNPGVRTSVVFGTRAPCLADGISSSTSTGSTVDLQAEVNNFDLVFVRFSSNSK